MKPIDSFNIRQLQDEIMPILNDVLNSPTLKEVLQKYGVLEASEIQLKLNSSKLKVQEIEVRIADESKPNFNITKLPFEVQEIHVHCSEYCLACDCFLECGTCPES